MWSVGTREKASIMHIPFSSVWFKTGLLWVSWITGTVSVEHSVGFTVNFTPSIFIFASVLFGDWVPPSPSLWFNVVTETSDVEVVCDFVEEFLWAEWWEWVVPGLAVTSTPAVQMIHGDPFEVNLTDIVGFNEVPPFPRSVTGSCEGTGD